MPKTGYWIAFFYNKCTKGDNCKFPHWSNEQTADVMSDNSTKEEVMNMMAAPCMMMEDEPEVMALAGVAVESHEYDEELAKGGRNGNMLFMGNNNMESYEYDWERIKGGHNGDILFVIDNDDLQRCEKA